MKIVCNRTLGEQELGDLKFTASIMELLNLNKYWTGDGDLYRTSDKNEFYYKDYKED